jgi:hypothetical protein
VPDETTVCKFRHCSRSRGWAGCSSMKARSISARGLAVRSGRPVLTPRSSRPGSSIPLPAPSPPNPSPE